MQIRRVTVFGASGFLGRYVVRNLAARGLLVAAAGRDPDRAKFLRPMGDVGQVAPVRANVTVDEDVRAAMIGADAVMNLVGILFESGSQKFASVQGESPWPHRADRPRARRPSPRPRLRYRCRPFRALGLCPHEGGRRKGVLDAFPGAVILRPSVIFGPEDGSSTASA